MRTTLTIDDDVAFALKRIQESEPKVPFKTIVNDALRRGLNGDKARSAKKRFKVIPHSIGLRTDLNFNNIEEVLDILDGVNRL